MNENDQTSASVASPKPRPLSWWLQKFFICNPFYPVSAALLLFGCYRVSIDAPFLNLESARLLFNFAAVQGYEILLVATAIFLARRRLWYDSTLLVGLESLLVFVPFILISQAALIDSRMAQVMCLAGAVVAIIRFGSLKKYFHQLNLPARLLEAGSVLLALNVLLPLIYRHFGQTKIGVYIDSGAAYEMNEFTWLLILPAALALVNLLPNAKAAGDLLPEHRWLPVGLFSVGISVTGMHVYALDFIYQFNLRGELVAPAVWVLAWSIFLRSPRCSSRQKYAMTFLPALVPLVSTSPGGDKTFLILTALNLGCYCAIRWIDRKNRFAGHVVYASILLFIAGVPDNWMRFIIPGLPPAQCVAAGVAAYLIFWIASQRSPKLAIVGSIILASTIMSMDHNHPGAIHWAMQGGFVFLLLHSLRWYDDENPGAAAVRIMTALVWVLQSFVWMNSHTGRFWMPIIPGMIVLGIYLASQIHCERWNQLVLPIAAFLVILSSPCSATVENLRSTPVGPLAVMGGFLLFGCGTVAALTRHHWHKHEPHSAIEPPQSPDPEP